MYAHTSPTPRGPPTPQGRRRAPPGGGRPARPVTISKLIVMTIRYLGKYHYNYIR